MMLQEASPKLKYYREQCGQDTGTLVNLMRGIDKLKGEDLGYCLWAVGNYLHMSETVVSMLMRYVDSADKAVREGALRGLSTAISVTVRDIMLDVLEYEEDPELRELAKSSSAVAYYIDTGSE